MSHLYDLGLHYLLPFLIVISVVVFVHEFGHYYIARLCGVRVEAFSIGFGREFFGWNDKNGTRWKVSLLPLGGYVKMFGDAGPSSTPDDAVHKMTDEEKKISFYHQSVDKRIAIVAAGPLTNYIFAILVLAVLFVFQGQPYSPPLVGGLTENGAATKAGIELGDTILSIDDATVHRFEDIKRIISLNAGTPVQVKVLRGSSTITLMMTPEVVMEADRFGGEHKLGRIGIKTNKIEYQKWSPPMAVYQAFLETWNLSAGALRAMGQIIVGIRGSEDLGGPLRIAKMSGEIAKDSYVSLIWFMAVISVNLGLINLFPVPLLDGGHIVFYFYEKLRGRPLHKNVQEVGFRVGMILVLSLMVFATWNDLVHLKVISYLRGLFS